MCKHYQNELQDCQNKLFYSLIVSVTFYRNQNRISKKVQVAISFVFKIN